MVAFDAQMVVGWVLLPKIFAYLCPSKTTKSTMQYLLVEQRDATLIITLNRPDKLNALNSGVLEEIYTVITEATQNDAIRGIILTGSGEKAFAAGADIAEFAAFDAAGASRLSARGHEILFAIENCPKPVIGAINGFSLGGGNELAMACHLRVASDNAKFGQPEPKLGLLPGYGATQRLVHLIGKARATELLITADVIDAQTALQYGMVNYVVSREALLPKCMEILEKTYAWSPKAIALTLEAVSAGVNASVNGYTVEANLFGEAIASDDGREGAKAFLEKRKPTFTGK